jgi:uncharacterized protein with PQ loop repeat
VNIPSLFGSLGTFIGLVRAVPQLLRLLRAREAHGVSVDTAAISSIVSFGWAAYGLLTRQPFVSLATGSSGVIFALVTVFALRSGRQVREFNIAPLWLGILLLAGFVWGESGLGILLPVSVLAANTPQIRVAWKEGNLSDLSLGPVRWVGLGGLRPRPAGFPDHGLCPFPVDHQRADRGLETGA